MNSYITLTKTFIASVSMSKSQDRKRKVMMIILSLFCVFGVLIPISVLMGFIVKLITDSLIALGGRIEGVQLMLQIITLFSFVFGFNVIFNEFYFSNDIEYLLPWPLKASQIIAAKFTASVFNENIMQCILVMSCIAGYGISAKLPAAGWLLSIIGVLTLPVLPMAYCGIICILIMAVSRKIRSRELVQRLTLIVIMALLLVFVLSLGALQNFDIDSFALNLAGGKQTFYNVMNYIFPNVTLYVRAFANEDDFALILYLLINVIAIAVMLLLADGLYFDGVAQITSASDCKKKIPLDAQLSKLRVHSAAYSYFMKEVRILLRTPVFLTNCVMVNYIWPVFVYAMYRLQKSVLTLADISAMYMDNNFTVRVLFITGIIAVSMIISAMNSISSGAISREGKHFAFMKYIPVSYMVQWNVKAVVGIIFPLSGVLIYFLPFCAALDIPLGHIALYTVICILSVTFVSYAGIYIDSIQPKLIWDDEMSALRENYNTFFTMGIVIMAAGVLCVSAALIYKFLGRSVYRTSFILILVLMLLNIFVAVKTMQNAQANISGQEEC